MTIGEIITTSGWTTIYANRNPARSPFTYRPRIFRERCNLLNARTEQTLAVCFALSARNLRLDGPLLLSRVSRFAPINAVRALDSATARRLCLARRACDFYAPLCAVPLSRQDLAEGSRESF
jgi:hypothetical protein